MSALIVAAVAGGIVGWLSRGRMRRALLLSVFACFTALGVMWYSRRAPEEVEIQWLVSQPGYWVFAYVLLLLPCMGCAAGTSALYRQIQSEKSK